MPETLTLEEQRLLDSYLASVMTNGASFDDSLLASNKEFFIQDGNIDAFMLYYFASDYITWEPINDVFFKFLEENSQGQARLPAQHGKDIACDTPILTTQGWKTMGTVRVGDEVYAEDGSPTRVTYTSDVFTDNSCFEVTFADGTILTAGEDHLWSVLDTDDDWQVLSTQVLAGKSWSRPSSSGGTRYRFRVRCDAVVDTPPVDLPIDPYILGLWLGDGHSAGARITVGHEDLSHLIWEILSAGYLVGSEYVDNRTGAITVGISAPDGQESIHARLRSLGVKDHKHIPESYLTASKEQRLALLAGLMDSDGSISKNRKASLAEFSVCSYELAHGFQRLARSLGIRVKINKNDAVLNGKKVGDRYRLCWYPPFNPFRLERKSSKWIPPQSEQHKLMSITGVRSVESVPTRCIQVEHPGGVFLVGELFTPTHNTTMILDWFSYVMCRCPDISCIYTEKNLPTAQQRCYALMGKLEANERLIAHYREFKGDLWSTQAFTIKQRPRRSDTPSFRVYGAGGGSVLGQRCNIEVNDDPVTDENNASDRERDSLYNWYTKAAATSPYPLPISNPRYKKKHFLVGTVFGLDDLYHRVAKAKEDDPTYAFLHLQAVPDELTGATLSPRFCYIEPDDLARKAEADPTYAELQSKIAYGDVENLYTWRKTNGTWAFYQRYQNVAIDKAQQKFPEIWFTGGRDDMSPPDGYPGCFDPQRHLGEDSQDGWVYLTGVDPAAGGTTRESVRFASVTIGYHPEDPRIIYLVDMEFGRYPLVSDVPGKKTQVDAVLDQVAKYHSRIVLETNNIQKVYHDVLRQAAAKRGMTIRVTGHYTSKEKRIDFWDGIDAMQPMVENGHLRLPYAKGETQRKVQELVDEMQYLGNFGTDDLVMALWFPWRIANRVARKPRQKFKPRELPDYFNRGQELKFPRHWTEEQKMAYLGLVKLDEEDDE